MSAHPSNVTALPTAQASERPVVTVPLDQLRASAANARKLDAGRDADAELVASIRENGLYQNLLVVDVDGQLEVVAGGRRLAALQQLAGELAIPADTPVPVARIDAADATLVSVDENRARAAMHPVDEFRAYGALLGQGVALGTIARRFGVPLEQVRQRLALGKLATPVLEAYAAGELDIKAVRAFTLARDEEQQVRALEAAREDARGYHYDDEDVRIRASDVRDFLTENSVHIDDRLAVFVGLTAYEAAGGTVQRDMFDPDNVLLTDEPLLERLAKELLDSIAQRVRAAGWAWVEVVSIDQLYLDKAQGVRTHELGRLKTKPELVDAEAQEKINGLDIEANAARAALRDVEAGERSAAKRRQRQTSAALSWAMLDRDIDSPPYTERQIRSAGATLVVAHDGAVRLDIGRTLPKPKKDAAAATSESAAAAGGAEVDSGFSKALETDLVMHRRAALRATIAEKPDVAGEILRHAIVQMRWTGSTHLHWQDGGYSRAYGLRSDTTNNDLAVGDMDGTPAGRALLEMRIELCEAGADDVAGGTFEQWLAAPEDLRDRLVAWSAATLVSAGTFVSGTGVAQRTMPALVSLERALEVDTRRWYTPDREGLFARMTKAQLLAAGEHGLRAGFADEQRGASKKELVEYFAGIWTRDEAGLSDDESAFRAAWAPREVGGRCFVGAEEEAR